MHLAIVILTIAITWRWADWKNWSKYHSTMIFVAMANLLYNFIYHDHFLWLLKPDFLFSHTVGEMFYTFIVFPFTALLLLSDFPDTLFKQLKRIAKYVLIYIVIEWIYLTYGRIEHNYGWSMWWSLAWDCIMFPLWVVHNKKPLLSYVLSFIVIILTLILFPVNLA